MFFLWKELFLLNFFIEFNFKDFDFSVLRDRFICGNLDFTCVYSIVLFVTSNGVECDNSKLTSIKVYSIIESYYRDFYLICITLLLKT